MKASMFDYAEWTARSHAPAFHGTQRYTVAAVTWILDLFLYDYPTVVALKGPEHHTRGRL